MVTLGAITLYNSISSNIAELRAELSREREARTELVKKDEFNSRTTTQYERIRSLDGLKAEFEGLKERVNGNAAAVEAIKKEVAAGTDAVKKDAAALEVLREKFAAAVIDLKVLRDETLKLQKEQDRNQASDLERKASRDAQHKQVDEVLKELQKGLQDCREKLARLEGSRPPEPKGKPAGEGN
jgi:chromosome segregation ATPase